MKTIKMKTKVAALILASFISGLANAVELDSYTINFSGAAVADGSAARTDLTNVDEWQFLAQSYLGFDDNDSSTGISKGDTFTDYTAVRITGFTNAGGDSITPLLYGAGPGRQFELTLLMQFSGIQTTANTYAVTALPQMDFFFDGSTDNLGTGFTASAFTDTSTFADGVRVESASLLVGGGNNTDPVLPNGTISLITELADELHLANGGEYFELSDDGDPLELIYELVLGIVDGNNLVDGNVNVAALASFFGFDPGAAQGGGLYLGGDFDFGFATKTDGSFNKRAVPEPVTLALLGIGLFGVGFARRKGLKSS